VCVFWQNDEVVVEDVKEDEDDDDDDDDEDEGGSGPTRGGSIHCVHLTFFLKIFFIYFYFKIFPSS
jgi:hypothetical protein